MSLKEESSKGIVSPKKGKGDELTQNRKAVIYAVMAALLYAISAPISKLLLDEIKPTMLAALLYLGAGGGLWIVQWIQTRVDPTRPSTQRIAKEQSSYVLWMILLDILAPILLMIGLTMTSAANASLLNNFEIVTTSMIALFFFNEKISKKLWVAIFLVTVSSMILSVEELSGFSFSLGSIFVLMACLCWGLENNVTRVLSINPPIQIVIIKGLGSGLGSLFIATILNDVSFNPVYIVLALILGFFAYGLSILFYVLAQRDLGAATTSAFYAFAPFMGAAISLMIFWEAPSAKFLIALSIMLVGAHFAYQDKKD